MSQACEVTVYAYCIRDNSVPMYLYVPFIIHIIFSTSLTKNVNLNANVLRFLADFLKYTPAYYTIHASIVRLGDNAFSRH